MRRYFFCKLVHNGYVQESFWREGESKKEIKEELECFQFPKGEWEILEQEELDQEES